LWTVCPGWLWTTILLISVSWIARITGMSHQCPACNVYLCSNVDLCSLSIATCPCLMYRDSPSNPVTKYPTPCLRAWHPRSTFFFFFLVSQASHLQSMCSTTWATFPVYFAVVFEMGGWVSWTIYLGWPQAAILLMSASQVARITGVSHWHSLFWCHEYSDH
jgi:hypothetical protein